MGNEEENNKEKEVSFFKSFIPQKISNETSITFFDFLRKTSQLNKDIIQKNLSNNINNFENHKKIIEKNKGFIEDQHSYKDMYYTWEDSYLNGISSCVILRSDEYSNHYIKYINHESYWYSIFSADQNVDIKELNKHFYVMNGGREVFNSISPGYGH